MIKKIKIGYGLILAFHLSFFVGCSSSEKSEGARASDTYSSPSNNKRKKSKTEVESSVDQVEVSNERGAGLAEERSRGSVSSVSVDDEEQEYADLQSAIKSRDQQRIEVAAKARLQKNPSDIRVLNALSVNAFTQGHLLLARFYAQKVLSIEPKSASANVNLGLIEKADGNERLAISYFQKALEIDSQHPPALANLGSIYVQGRDFKKAHVVFSDAYKAGYRGSDFLKDYALASAAVGDTSTADKIYGELMKSDSGNKSILLNRAIYLVQVKKDLKQGEEVISRIKVLGVSGSESEILKRLEAMIKGG